MNKDELKAYMAQQPMIVFALLFGSRGRGTARADSDWDLAVYLDDTLTAKQRFALRLRLQSELEDLGKVDLVLLNEAPPLLAHRALTGERLLIRDASKFNAFVVQTLGLAEDQRYWLQLHRRGMSRRLQEGTFG